MRDIGGLELELQDALEMEGDPNDRSRRSSMGKLDVCFGLRGCRRKPSWWLEDVDDGRADDQSGF